MAKKRPYLPVYVGDWLRLLAGQSLAAQGLYLRMEFLAHDSERYGYLCENGSPIPPHRIARCCGCDLGQYEALLAELDSVTLLGRTPDGILYCARLVEIEKRRVQGSKNGRKGGNPQLLYEWFPTGVNPRDKLAPDIDSANSPGELFGIGGPGERVPAKLRTPRFFDAWGRWVQYRKEIGKPMTHSMAEAQLKQFDGWGEDRAVAAIEHTICRGWWGLREPEAGRQPSRNGANGATPAERKRTAVEQALERRIAQ